MTTALEPAEKRSWFRFRLQTLFVLILVAACLLNTMLYLGALRREAAAREEAQAAKFTQDQFGKLLNRTTNQRAREFGRVEGFLRSHGLYEEYLQMVKSHKPEDDAEDQRAME